MNDAIYQDAKRVVDEAFAAYEPIRSAWRAGKVSSYAPQRPEAIKIF
jgi:hypothetical protein